MSEIINNIIKEDIKKIKNSPHYKEGGKTSFIYVEPKGSQKPKTSKKSKSAS